MMKGQKGFVRIRKRSFQARSLKAAWRKVVRWHQLARERRKLAGLSDETLKDLGLTRVDVEHEWVRPFWDDPLPK